MVNHTYNVCLWGRGLQLKHEDLLARPLQQHNNNPHVTCICLSPLNKSGCTHVQTLGDTGKEIGVQLLTADAFSTAC